MKVVRIMTAMLAPPAISPDAMNCADPAKTKSDIPIAPAKDRPLALAAAPKIRPKGIAPTTRGKVSLTQAQTSFEGQTIGSIARQIDCAMTNSHITETIG